MTFQPTYRIFAIDPDLVGILFPALLEAYGQDVPDGRETVRTIGVHWDDTEQTRLRAASFPTTATGQILTDGRMAFRCMWQADLAAAFDAGGLLGVEELTEAQLATLTPQPEVMP